MESIVVFAGQSKFPVILICSITSGSASSAGFYLNLLLSSFNALLNKDNLEVNQLRNSCASNLLNVIICSCIIFYRLIKKFLPLILTEVFISTAGSKYSVYLVWCALFQMTK